MKKTLIHIACVAVMVSACRKSEPHSSGKSEITVKDLLMAQGISAFMVELPKDIQKTDVVHLELFGETGVMDSAPYWSEFKSGQIVKIFIQKEGEGYQFSMVCDHGAKNSIVLKLGEAKLSASEGNSDTKVFQVGNPLAAFSVDDSASFMNPKGDDLILRVVVEIDGRQASGSKPK